MNLKNTRLFSKKILLIWFLLTSLIFPAVILAQEPEGVLLTGVFADSSNSQEQEILNQGAAKTFNVRLVWTYDQTDIITGPLEAFAAAKGMGTIRNGLEEPLLSEISGYQKKAIAHSAAVITAINLAKEGKLWGDELYLVSPALISQDDLRQIRDLTSQGKGFNKIVLYTGDDMIPDFKELHINFKDYTIRAKITENSEVSLIKLLYEDRDREVNVLEEVLSRFATRAKGQLGKEPVLVTIYGDIPGNKLEIKWEDGTIEPFNLQKDAQTGEDFQSEGNIEVIPLYEGFPHGRAQLEVLEKFYKEHNRMPENNKKEDIAYFKQSIQKASSEILAARDPNEKLVSPEGDIRPGDRLDYTIKYENEGKGIAYAVYITDTLDEDLDGGSTLTVNDGGSYDPETRTITWFIGEVGPGVEGSVTFSVNVKQDAPDKAEVINFATVYFPSVPEATRTNGTVNRVTTATDTTPPTTTASILPTPNSDGWNNSDVTVTLTSIENENGSGIAKTEYSLDSTNWITYTAPFVITTEGTTKVYYKSTDNTGNIESVESLEIKIDKTPPTITSQASPQPNAYNWNNTDVTVSFTAQDTISGVATTTHPATITTEGANQHIGGEAEDRAGNKASTYVTLNIDKTPPLITAQASPQPNSLGWNNSDVTVTFTGQDNLSGIQSITQPVTISTEGENQNIKGEAIDFADNKASVSILVNIDKTLPEVLINTPQNLATYLLNQTIITDWIAQDVLSGIESVAATTPDQVSINLVSVGNKTFSVLAKDKAGNQKGHIVTYKVIYNFSGILPPIKTDGSSVFKLGSTVPVKFQLKDAQGNFITNAVAKLSIQKYSDNEPFGESIEAVSTANSTTGNLFRYDTAENQYIFNLSTKALSTGLWQLKLELDDGEKYTVFVGLK